MANTIVGVLGDVKAVLEKAQEFEKGQGGFLGTWVLGKKAIIIVNNTDKAVKLQVDKDIITDGGGGELASGECDGFARSGPTGVLVDGTSAGKLVPGKKYVITSEGVEQLNE